MAPSCGDGSVSMKDAGVVEEDKITRLQPVDYGSRRIAATAQQADGKRGKTF